MKNLFFLGLVLLIFHNIPAVSQEQSEAFDAIAILQKIEKENELLLQRQKQSLEKLEELNKTANQLRIIAKRG